MQLEARGLPIHTRTLSVTLSAADDGAVAFDAYVLDLRKRGFVPVAGDLQGTGIIHHMLLAGTLDPPARPRGPGETGPVARRRGLSHRPT